MLLKVQFPGKVTDFVTDFPLAFDFGELLKVFIMHAFNAVSLNAFLGYIINAQFSCQWLCSLFAALVFHIFIKWKSKEL